MTTHNPYSGWDSGVAYYDPSTRTGYTINQYNAVSQRASVLDPLAVNQPAAFAQATRDVLGSLTPSFAQSNGAIVPALVSGAVPGQDPGPGSMLGPLILGLALVGIALVVAR